MSDPRSVTFRVVGKPEPKGSTRAFLPKGHPRPVVTSDNPAARQWQYAIAWSARALDVAPFTDAVAVSVAFTLPRPKRLPKTITQHTRKPDIDKLARCVLDALCRVLISDDARVVELHVTKAYAPTGTAAGARITVTERMAEIQERRLFAEAVR